MRAKKKKIRVLVRKVIQEIVEVEACNFGEAYHKLCDGYGNPEVVATRISEHSVDPNSPRSGEDGLVGFREGWGFVWSKCNE